MYLVLATWKSRRPAVRKVLRRPVETANRVVKVHSVVTTQNKLLQIAPRAVGADGWTVKKVSVEAMLESSRAEFSREKRGLQDNLGRHCTCSLGRRGLAA